jgi:LPS sulfotransferase NodH
VRGIVAAAATPNAVFGFRLMAWDVERFVSKLRLTNEFGTADAPEIELLRSALPRLQFIHLSRADQLRQAISKARALQTGLWKIGNGKALGAEPKFDPDLIAHCLESARVEEKFWSDFFARNAIEPIRITYEALCRDYKRTVEAVLDFLAIRLPRTIAVGDPVTVRQTDELTAEWEERYRALAPQLAVS